MRGSTRRSTQRVSDEWMEPPLLSARRAGGNSRPNEAVKIFKSKALDSLIVVDGNKPVGVLDVQDLIKLGLLGQEHL